MALVPARSHRTSHGSGQQDTSLEHRRKRIKSHCTLWGVRTLIDIFQDQQDCEKELTETSNIEEEVWEDFTLKLWERVNLQKQERQLIGEWSKKWSNTPYLQAEYNTKMKKFSSTSWATNFCVFTKGLLVFSLKASAPRDPHNNRLSASLMIVGIVMH